MPNIGQQFLQETPQAAFMSFLPQLNRPMRRYFGREFGDIYGEYQGALGQEAQATGQLPQMQFMDFLSAYPFIQRYFGLSPYERGADFSRLAPRTRFLTTY